MNDSIDVHHDEASFHTAISKSDSNSQSTVRRWIHRTEPATPAISYHSGTSFSCPSCRTDYEVQITESTKPCLSRPEAQEDYTRENPIFPTTQPVGNQVYNGNYVPLINDPCPSCPPIRDWSTNRPLGALNTSGFDSSFVHQNDIPNYEFCKSVYAGQPLPYYKYDPLYYKPITEQQPMQIKEKKSSYYSKFKNYILNKDSYHQFNNKNQNVYQV